MTLISVKAPSSLVDLRNRFEVAVCHFDATRQAASLASDYPAAVLRPSREAQYRSLSPRTRGHDITGRPLNRRAAMRVAVAATVRSCRTASRWSSSSHCWLTSTRHRATGHLARTTSGGRHHRPSVGLRAPGRRAPLVRDALLDVSDGRPHRARVTNARRTLARDKKSADAVAPTGRRIQLRSRRCRHLDDTASRSRQRWRGGGYAKPGVITVDRSHEARWRCLGAV